MILLSLLLIPTLIALFTFLFGQRRVTWKEFLFQMGAQVLLVGLFYSICLWTNTSDVEVWNGRVASKTREVVHCRHSYSCNCVRVSCGKDCSTTVCQTCYYHSYDVDWFLSTTNQETIDIDTVDWQGLREPPRWTRARVGDTTALTHGFTNYVKAAPDSLFRRVGLTEKYEGQLPTYPQQIYDYHYLDRLVQVGTRLSDAALWNKELREMNSDIGKSKEVNIVVVVTKNRQEEFFYALEQEWIGGKKNDVIVMINTNDSNEIDWVNTMAWTDNQIFKINMRDSLLKLKNLDRELILPTVRAVVQKDYIRKSMEDYAYLKQSITPTKGEYIGLTIFGILLSLGISWFVFTNEITEIERKYNGYRN